MQIYWSRYRDYGQKFKSDLPNNLIAETLNFSLNYCDLNFAKLLPQYSASCILDSTFD